MTKYRSTFSNEHEFFNLNVRSDCSCFTIHDSKNLISVITLTNNLLTSCKLFDFSLQNAYFIKENVMIFVGIRYTTRNDTG